MRESIFIKLLFLMIFSAHAEELELIVPQIKKKYIVASTMCYLEKKLIDQIEDCQPVIKLIKKKKITKTLNRQIFCDQVISNYIINLKPSQCKITYCSPCIYTETIA